MMREDDLTYYNRRVAEEQERARTSNDPGIAKIHRELAEGYLRRVSELDGGGRLRAVAA